MHDRLKTGYTTGACAAAAAAAAVRALLGGQAVDEIEIDLPARKGVAFRLARCEFRAGGVTCGVVKDAGDDPDVTHGAEIQATAEWRGEPGLLICGGRGVGVVTRPGLPVPVGEPAINPGPRRLIAQAVAVEAGSALEGRGLKVTICVPGGEEIAEQTLNPRLGIVGGISILGTTGIVRPFSTSAYRASIYVELKVAACNGARRAVLSTGNRSEKYALARYRADSELGFVQVGDNLGHALRQARRLGFSQVVIAGMVGKISKLAQGRMQTHVGEGGVDLDFLADLSGQLGADEALKERIRSANTARHVQEMLSEAGIAGLEPLLAQMAAGQVGAFVGGNLEVEVLLYDLDGDLLGEGKVEKKT